MPGWLDNGFHAHDKRELGALAVDGLLCRAISRASDQLSDGWVAATWVEKQLSDGLLGPKQRVRVIELAVQHRVLEPVAAGETKVIIGAPRSKLRAEEIKVTVGPHDVDGYMVHDYLDCNRASFEVERRRREDRDRQQKRRNGRKQEQIPPADQFWDTMGKIDADPLAGDTSSSSRHASVTRDNTRDPRDRDRDVNHQNSDQTDLNDARGARSADPGVQSVLDVLRSAPRLHVDVVGVENAMRAFPTGDAVKAAREVVTLGTDPAWRITNAAKLLWQALERQTTATTSPALFAGHRGGDRPTAADFLALKTGAVR